MFDKNMRALLCLAAEGMSEGERTGAVENLDKAAETVGEVIGFFTAGMSSKTLDAAVTEILTDIQIELMAIRGIAQRGGERQT